MSLSWPATCGRPCPERRCDHEGCHLRFVRSDGRAGLGRRGRQGRIRSNFHWSDRCADGGRSSARRSHAAPSPAGRDGPADRGPDSRAIPVWPAHLQHALFPKTPEQKAMIDAIAQFGILLLLLLTGMETDLKLVRQTGRASLFASLMGIVIPFVCGVVLVEMLPDSMLPESG